MPLVCVSLSFMYMGFLQKIRVYAGMCTWLETWNRKNSMWYLIRLWKGSKLHHTWLKRKGSLTSCFPRKAIMYFDPKVCEIYALHVSLLCTLIWFSPELTNETCIGPKPKNIYEAISCLVNYWRECLVCKTCLQFAGSPPISLNRFGNLGLNYLPEGQQFLKTG